MFYEKIEQLVIQLKQTLVTSYILCFIIMTFFHLKVLVSYFSLNSRFQNAGILRPNVFGMCLLLYLTPLSWKCWRHATSKFLSSYCWRLSHWLVINPTYLTHLYLCLERTGRQADIIPLRRFLESIVGCDLRSFSTEECFQVFDICLHHWMVSSLFLSQAYFKVWCQAYTSILQAALCTRSVNISDIVIAVLYWSLSDRVEYFTRLSRNHWRAIGKA